MDLVAFNVMTGFLKIQMGTMEKFLIVKIVNVMLQELKIVIILEIVSIAKKISS